MTRNFSIHSLINNRLLCRAPYLYLVCCCFFLPSLSSFLIVCIVYRMLHAFNTFHSMSFVKVLFRISKACLICQKPDMQQVIWGDSVRNEHCTINHQLNVNIHDGFVCNKRTSLALISYTHPVLAFQIAPFEYFLTETGKLEFCVIHGVDEKFKIYCWFLFFVFCCPTLFIQTPQCSASWPEFLIALFILLQFVGTTFWYFPLQFKLQWKPTVWLDS